MDVSFTKRYASESEFLYDLAQSSPYFRQEDYKAFSEIEQSDVYTSTIAATRDKTSTTFDTYEYDLLAGQDRLSYLYNEYLQDKNETATDEQTGETYNVYERNKQYLNARLDEAIDAKTFDSLNGFEKVMHTIGGVVGNALNTLFLGTTEGLLDVLSLGLGSFAAQIGWTEATDAITKFIAQDTTGYQKNQEELQRYARAYTYIDKSGFVNVINDVVSGITQMAPMLIPGVGAAIYFGGMAGNISEEAVRANPDINYWALMGYTAAVGSVEGLTEKISGAFFGGSAIDNLMFKSSKNVLGGWATRIGFNFASEGLEEAISEFADSVLYTAMVDPNAPLASIEEILYAGLIGGLIGGVTGAIEIGTAERLTINGKQLTKLESLAYQGQLQNAIELTKKSAVDSLMVKYSNLNIEQIKTQHAQEYQNAVEKDNKTTRKLAEATIALAKLVDIAGVEKIQKAAKLVDYQIESYANLMKKYVARATSNIAANRAVEEKFATKNPGQSITINDVLTENQRKLKQELKSAYGIDAYFGNLGARDGLIKNNGLTLDEKTIVIDDRLFNEMSLDQIMTTVIREELVHTLQFGEGKLTKETLNKLREIYTQQGGKIQEGGDLDLAYSRSSTLTKQAELEAKAICQMLLFDEITISRVFSTNTNVFFKVFNTLKNLKKNIESKKTKRTNKDKVRFREILKAMGRYKDAAAHNIGNKEDLNIVADKMDLDDADKQDIADKMLPNYDTKHFTQLMDSFTMSVAKHKEATNFLMSKRQDDSIFFPKLDYSKVFDENYYTADFVQEIKTRNPEKDFRYNLQEAMINDFGFTINDKAGALMEVVDLTEMTTKDFRYDITDLAIDSSRIDKYTNLAQIFEPEFVRKFDSPFGNELEAIKINVVKTTSDTSTKATYNHFKGVITIKLNANKLTNFAESDALKHSILHETVHALSAIQNLAWGTSSKYIRSGLNVLPTKTINSLAEKLLTKEFYEQNKDNLDVLLDNIAYGIYRITDSEYAAEAYKTSKWRKNDIELKLKAGATMNRSGFYISDFGKLSGYGRFAGIEIKLGGEQLVSQENVKSKNLQDATEVVAYSRVSTIGEFIKNKGYKDFESAGFSEEAIKVFSDPYSKYGDVQALLNTNNVGSKEATNLIIEWLNANKSKSRLEGVTLKSKNEYMVTADDIRDAKLDGIAMAHTYHEYRRRKDSTYKGEKPLTYEYLKEFFDKHKQLRDTILLTSSYEDSKGNLQFKTGYLDKISELIGKERNSGLADYLIRIDYDYSKGATDTIVKALNSLKGIKGIQSESQTTTLSKKDSSNEVNQIDQQIGKEYGESEGFGDPAKLLEGLEDDKVSENKFKNLTVDEFITALGVRIKELSNSPKYFTLEKNITDSSKKVNKTLKLVYGEDGFKKIKDYVQSNMSSREKFNKQRKRRIEKISKIPNLSAEAKQKVAQPYATFSPTQYEEYIASLDEIIEVNEKRQAQKAEPVIEEVKEEPVTVKEKSIDMRPSAIVAPYLANNILNQKDYNKSKKAVDEKFKNAAQALAKDLGLEIEEVHNNLGGYTFGAGESITELSYTFIFKEGDFETIKLFASIMGDIAHETQESVVASQPLSEDSDAQPDALRLTYTVKDVKGVEKILKKLGINDFTIDKVNNTVSVLSFDVEDVDKLKTYPKEKIQEKIDAMLQGYEQLEQELGDNLYGKEFEFIKSSLLESDDRRELYKAWLDSAKVQKQKGDAGDSSIQQAIQQALQQIDKKYPVQQTPVIKEEIVTKEQPVDEQPTEIDVVKQDIEHIQKVSSSEADSIVNAIINKYRTATTGISEAQFFDEETDMVYLKVGEQMESELSPFFAAVTDENYQAVRDGILTSKEFFADQALVLFDMYTLAVEGKFSPETREKIQAYNRRALTKSAQRLNRQAKRVAERNGVSHLVSSFKENDINVTVTDKIVGDTFPELANKEKRIAELEEEVKSLNDEIRSMQDMSSAVVSLTEQRDELKSKLELAEEDSAEAQKLQAKIDELTSELDSKTTQLSKLEELYEKQKELSTEIMVLENGTNEEIIDFFINKLLDKGILGSEKAAEKLQHIMEQLVLNATINRDGKEIGIYTYDAKGRPKPFPEVLAKIDKMAKKLQSFRMWSMLSSPITYVRNWMGNVGMRGLELATKKITRAIEKELSDEQYKEIIDKKENTKEILKVKRRIEKRNDKLKNEKISKEEKNKIEKQLEADEKILNNIKAIEGVDKSKDVADLEKDILGYEFQENQFNLNTRKATDETVKYVNENFEKQIEAITSGTMKYTTDDANVQKAITTKEESLKIKAEQGTWWERAKAKAELYEIKGLETGWFGDRKFFRKSMTQNFADILESNKTNFIRRLEKERTRLEAKKNPTIDDLARLDEINFALKTQEMRDLVKYTPQTYINLLLDKAADISRKQYFKNSNALSRFLADVGKKNPMLGTVVSFIMPFPKVAYNILATAIDYSPLGLIKGWLQGKTIQQMEKGNYKQMTGFEKAERAETLSKGVVGTMMFVAGALAAILGWVDVEEDDYLGLSLHINLGADIRISLSNLAPSMTTFSTAAAMIWAYKEDKGFNGIMKQALSTLYDNTLLGNIENIFAYGSLENWASNATISWISQYIPAVLKLVTKTIDPRKKDKSGNYWTKLIRTLGSYLPGISTLVPSKINPYTGDPMYNTGTDDFWVNFFTGISPLDIDVTNNYKTALEREAERIGATTTGYSGKFTVNGEDFIPEDKEKYAKYRANYISSQYQKIVSGKEKVTVEDENGKRKTTTYDKLTDEQKKNVLNRLYSDAASKTKIKAWVEEGNYYYTSNKDEYNELRKLLNNNKIIYRSSWSKSKFVNK